MKLRVLGCSGGSVKGRYLSCFLLNDRVAIDAGGLTGPLTLDEQLGVGHVIVSHTHLDHNCGLPFFVDNIFGLVDEPIIVYGIEGVLDSLKRHMFNDEIWPDFTRLPSPESPAMKFQVIEPEKPFEIEGVTFTPVAVDHLTPTVGVLADDGESAVLYTSDTGPTERVWEMASQAKNLKAIITEVSFSNKASSLAHVSGHMTPAILEKELEKLTADVPVLITHTKPGHLAQIRAELDKLAIPRLELIEQDKVYHF